MYPCGVTTSGVEAELQALAVELLVHSARVTRLASRRTASSVPSALWRVLSQLDELGSLRVSELAAVDRCSQPSATALVQRLAMRGWVDRTTDPDDARAVRIAITDDGRRVLTRQRARAGQALVPDLVGLDEKDRRRLADGLDVLRRVVRTAAHD